MNPHNLKPKARGCAGQIELFVALVVVGTLMVIAYALFLVDYSVSAYYKEKLQFLSAQGATFAANHPGAGVQAATKQVIKGLCADMGLHASNLTVTVQNCTVNGQPGVICLACASFPLLQASLFPANVVMSGSSAAQSLGTVPQIINLKIAGNNNQFIDPNASVTGSASGNGNSVIASGGSSIGNGATSGNGNVNTGSGSVSGNGNVDSGSGNLSGNGNNWQ